MQIPGMLHSSNEKNQPHKGIFTSMRLIYSLFSSHCLLKLDSFTPRNTPSCYTASSEDTSPGSSL